MLYDIRQDTGNVMFSKMATPKDITASVERVKTLLFVQVTYTLSYAQIIAAYIRSGISQTVW